ncbi:MAG: ATP-binding protein [Eubacteriales bacterium]
MKNRGIKFKILLIFILIFILLATNSIWVIINFNSLSNSIENIMESNYKTIEAAQSMTVAIERQDSAELEQMFSNSDTTSNSFRENEVEFLRNLSRAEDNITEEGEAEILSRINTLYIEYVDKYSILVDIQNNEGSNSAKEYYYNEILPLFEETKEETRELLTLNQLSMVSRKDRAHDISTSATFSTMLISILTIIIGIVMAIYLSNKVVKPIQDLITKIKKIAEGDYKQQLDISGSDEIARLATEFNTMTKKLQSYELLNIKKLMEEKQKSDAIVESISDGIIVTNDEHKILLVNRAAEKALDIREKEALNRHFLEVIKREDIFKTIEKVKDKSPNYEHKKYLDISLTVDGENEYYRLNVRPITTREGENIGVVTLMQNITKLKEVDQIKSDFVSTVSHEFRTPLTSITMGVGLLLDEVPGPINEEQKELVEAIEEDSERLRKLVSDLLDLSRMESGNIKMDIERQNLKEILDNSIKPFKRQLEEHNVDIEVKIRKNLSKVKVDFNKISWVFTNLIGNALRYLPEDKKGKIIINAKETANKMLISVSDNGKGISEEYQQKIFEKFIQSKDNDNKGGTGLGLAISKEIVNAHGGEIWVKSKIGEGSTFYFTVKLG